MKIVLGLVLFSVVLWASPQGVPVNTTFTCGVTSLEMLAQNNNRAYVIIQNQGSDTTGHCYIKAGATVVSTDGLWIDHGQNYEPIAAFIKKPWYCRCDSAGQVFQILEANY